jgi:hypothetical protein
MDFHHRAMSYLRSEFPEATTNTDDSTLHTAIDAGIRRAQLYKLVSEADVMRFIDLQWRMGSDFDTNPAYPWAAEILSDLRIPPKDKIAMLRDAYSMEPTNAEAAHE